MTDQPTAGTEAPLLHGRASDLTRRWLNLLGPLLGLALIFGIFTFLVPGGRFATYGNIESMLRQSAAVIVAALGMTFVIIAGGIDLSLASIVALSSVITARVLLWGATDIRGSTDFIAAHPFWIPTLAAAAGILCGMLCGLLNGALITGLRVAPFIITLGMMMVFRGAAKRFAGQRGQIEHPIADCRANSRRGRPAGRKHPQRQVLHREIGVLVGARHPAGRRRIVGMIDHAGWAGS